MELHYSSKNKMPRTGSVLNTSDDVAIAVKLRSLDGGDFGGGVNLDETTATSERWGGAPLLSNGHVNKDGPVVG